MIHYICLLSLFAFLVQSKVHELSPSELLNILERSPSIRNTLGNESVLPEQHSMWALYMSTSEESAGTSQHPQDNTLYQTFEHCSNGLDESIVHFGTFKPSSEGDQTLLTLFGLTPVQDTHSTKAANTPRLFIFNGHPAASTSSHQARKGVHILTHRQHIPLVNIPSEFSETSQKLSDFILSHVPRTFIHRASEELRPTAHTVYFRADLATAMGTATNIIRRLGLSHHSPSGKMTYVAVITPLGSKVSLPIIAATFSAGARLQGAGNVEYILMDIPVARALREDNVLPKATNPSTTSSDESGNTVLFDMVQFEASHLGMGHIDPRTLKMFEHKSNLSDILATGFAASRVTSAETIAKLEDQHAKALIQQADDTRAAPKDSLHWLTNSEQFHRELVDVISAVRFIFFLRLNDVNSGLHLNLARVLQEEILLYPYVTQRGTRQNVYLRFFLVDAEQQPDVARAFQLSRTPGLIVIPPNQKDHIERFSAFEGDMTGLTHSKLFKWIHAGWVEGFSNTAPVSRLVLREPSAQDSTQRRIPYLLQDPRRTLTDLYTQLSSLASATHQLLTDLINKEDTSQTTANGFVDYFKEEADSDISESKKEKVLQRRQEILEQQKAKQAAFRKKLEAQKKKHETRLNTRERLLEQKRIQNEERARKIAEERQKRLKREKEDGTFARRKQLAKARASREAHWKELDKLPKQMPYATDEEQELNAKRTVDFHVQTDEDGELYIRDEIV